MEREEGREWTLPLSRMVSDLVGKPLNLSQNLKTTGLTSLKCHVKSHLPFASIIRAHHILHISRIRVNKDV
jgi:hypothetical protein